MAERFQDLDICFDSRVLTDTIRELGAKVLGEIEVAYGQDGANPKPYHNTGHTLLVTESCLAIARAAGLDDSDQAKVVLAGLFHDRFHDEAAFGLDEAKSADYAYISMRATDIFTPSDCKDVHRAILDTRCQPQRDSVGQQPESELGKIVADADMSYFGMPTDRAWDITANYFNEITPGESLQSETFGHFAERFARILERHRFHNPATGSLYPHAQVNAAYAWNVSQTLLAA